MITMVYGEQSGPVILVKVCFGSWSLLEIVRAVRAFASGIRFWQIIRQFFVRFQ